MDIESHPVEPVRPSEHPGGARPVLILGAALFTVLMTCAISAAAMLAPAPVGVVPLIVIICAGAPLFAVWPAPAAWAALRRERRHRHATSALRELRTALDELPETEHPLGH